MLAGGGLRRSQRKRRGDRGGQHQRKEASRRRGERAGEERSRAEKGGALAAAEEGGENAGESRRRQDRQRPAPGAGGEPGVELGPDLPGGGNAADADDGH